MKLAPYTYSDCRVIRILDGDTVDLWINLGFSTFTKKRIRMFGIDAPETRTRDKEEKARGIKAKDRLIELLSQDQTSDEWSVDLESHEIGKFGRVIGTIWRGNANINQQMLLEGHATPYRGGKR